MTTTPDWIYVGRNRLHRSRANLIQTLNTVAALTEMGLSIRLYLPPWPTDKITIDKKLNDLFIPTKIDAVRSQLLHPRWKFWPFIKWNYKTLKQAKQRYTRSAEISIALGKAKLSHHLEIHDFFALKEKKQLDIILKMHANKTIGLLISITEATRQMLINEGADPSRIHVATSGVNLHAFNNVSPFNPQTLSQPNLVYIGRMSNDYGRHIFQEIAQTTQYQITLVGGSKEDESPNISIKPFAPYHQVIDWHDRMSIALMPYQPSLKRIETLSPMKLFEAFGAGRPIIASDLPVIREIITHEHNGLLVDPANPKAWIDAIQRLQNDPALAVKLAENAKASALQYAWPARAKGIVNAVNALQPV
ncbi:D-inositol-3-phosphate glycosyltransferase [Poriferisphaera corsica]|uniref:D-inositol-3-phosphate glycosyltransferase n=1 Tax=Poriferisphaera corsica TaxID=2528020 RepID=A0A517YXX2_9BACT|nr:glycosyltransferase family 4 protein [Poriferisphaera corsica]QDU35080.1 D-inositol-3-phosphate glycosyltransferase [Poriferisphaera corsica]